MRPFVMIFNACAAALIVPATLRAADDYPIRPPAMRDVRTADGFWGRRLEINRAVTLPHVLDQCERSGRLANFAKAAGKAAGAFQGLLFDDSDVYKAIEGAACTLVHHPDAALEARLDQLIADIVAAQQPDGYLNTYFTLAEPQQRWADLRNKHELYCAGHLFEAAVAHHEATGKRTLLDVATRLADHVVERFGPGSGRTAGVPGHPEIELALCRLHQATGRYEYLELAEHFLAMRGRADKRPTWDAYYQDHKPIIDQDEAVGHAVRAAYLYCGMLDVAALRRESAREYVNVAGRLWTDVAYRKLYLTGGLGARADGESFGAPFELPNDSAYAETCAAIANAMWNWRLFRTHGDGAYLDVLERVLYNGFLAGVDLRGDRFFYPNPLASDGVRPFNHGARERQPWFACACCPVNVVRFIPQIPTMAYAQRGRAGEGLYVNLFMASTASFDVRGARVVLKQETDYPWSGAVRLSVEPDAHDLEFTLHVRVPGWARGRPVPSDLYHYVDPAPTAHKLAINGRSINPPIDNGFATLRRKWNAGDVVTLDLPMPIRRVVADSRVQADVGRVALERGPLVYCVEAVDHDGHALALVLPDDAELRPERREDLLGGVTVLRGAALLAARDAGGGPVTRPTELTAVPYYAWSHRGLGAMTVWIARDADHARLPPPPTIASRARASASHCWASDTVAALNDQVLPESSGDHGLPRLTWWDHRGTREWVQYDLSAATRVRAVEVYWFDDTGRGYCRLPASWRVLCRAEDGWRPVAATGEAGASEPTYGVAANRMNRVEFEPVTTEGLRLEVLLQPGFSGGILEWRVE
jgi:DUF1680 family protein